MRLHADVKLIKDKDEFPFDTNRGCIVDIWDDNKCVAAFVNDNYEYLGTVIKDSSCFSELERTERE